MSMAAARGWGAASTGIASAGEMLLREMARKKEEQLAAEKLALEAELGRGDLSYRRDALGQADRHFGAGLERDYTMGGFVDAPAEVSPGPRRSLLDPNASLFDGKGIGLASGSTPGGALLSSLTGGGPSASPSAAMPRRKVYDPTADPAEIRAGNERTFQAGESAAERAARLEIERQGNQTQLEAARIQDSGATARNTASISSNERMATQERGYDLDATAAQAEAVSFAAQFGNDPARALAALDGDNTPEAQMVRRELQKMQYDKGRRALMGIGQNGPAALLNSLGVSLE